jgi:hypothetical protein
MSQPTFEPQHYSHTCPDGVILPPIELVRYKALDNGIRIWMSWCDHEIEYEYEFKGHGDPDFKVDGDRVELEELPDLFPVYHDDYEISTAISMASATFTPSYEDLYKGYVKEEEED